MTTKTVTIEEILQRASQLPPADKLELAAQLISGLRAEGFIGLPPPTRSLYGLWADLGPMPGDEEIAEARREMWGTLGEGDDY